MTSCLYEFASSGENSFLLGLATIKKGSKNDNDRVLSPDDIHIFINMMCKKQVNQV